MFSRKVQSINRQVKIALPTFILVGLMLVLILTGCSPASTPTATAPITTLPPVSQPAASTPAAPAAPAATSSASAASPAPSTSATPRVYNSKEIIMASTTSTRDSGLMDAHNSTNFPNWTWDGLIPLFQKQSGYQVKAVYVGSGAAIAQGQQGNADVLLVHSPAAELKFVSDGYGINRQLVMHNDFVILGPSSDPAGIKGMTGAVDAFKKISAAQSAFYSRGDNSGTDVLEKGLWAKAGLTVKDGASTNPGWYVEGSSGTGMGALLMMADQKQGYTLADRATYLAFKDKIGLVVMVQGDPALLNVYHVIQVNPEKFQGIVNADGAKAFVDFMISPSTQALIANYGVEKYGQPLFVPDAGKTEAELGSK
jgi:tungstate transport system substrate-binding protein